MSDKLKDIFFYGLFMDERVLREKGVRPHASRKTVVKGYRLKIGDRAMLVPEPASQVFGMVHALTEHEINSLYAEPGLDMYRPETVVATFEDGSSSAVTTFNLQQAPTEGTFNAEYAMKLRSVLERLGFPITFLVLLLFAAGCMSMFQSSFASRFSLKELLQRNPTNGLNCAGSGGASGGIGASGGGLGSGHSNFHRGESVSCLISDAEQFDEAKFIQALRESVEKDLDANHAEITGSKNPDATKFSIEYVAGSTVGSLEISATRSAGYYSLQAQLNEKTDAK